MSKEAMKQIADIAEGSTTANSLQHIAKIARKAVAESEKQEKGEPVACDNCKKLEDELEHLRIKAELWKRDAIVWKSAYDVEVGFREQEQGEPLFKSIIEKHEGLAEELAAMDKEQGEPVAWRDRTSGNLLHEEWLDADPLYTTPQQRTWVGLDEEDDIDLEEGGSLRDLVEAVEAKLREKNT